MVEGVTTLAELAEDLKKYRLHFAKETIEKQQELLRECLGALRYGKHMCEMLMRDGGAAATEIREVEHKTIMRAIGKLQQALGAESEE